MRKATQTTRLSGHYHYTMNYLLLTNSGEPEHYEEVKHTDAQVEWESAIGDEMSSLIENKTWDLMKLLEGKQALHNRWIYRIKDEDDGSRRYNAIFVVKDYEQKTGVDYTNIFAPIVNLKTIWAVFSLVVVKDLQLDAKTIFLHRDLEEEIYMHQPVGFAVKDKEDLDHHLNKSLYELKQAPR